MGLLRLLLASLVLASHVPEFLSPYLGAIAVECFYIISGFYIQMILLERYMGQPAWRRKFLESRLLRIYVPYWIILLALGLLMPLLLHPHDLRHHFSPLVTNLWDYPSRASTWLTLLANIFILGTDDMKLIQTATGCEGSGPVIITQVWSVGIELMFYFIAPFLLLCRTLPLIVITLAAIIGKIAVLYAQPGAAFFECGDGLLDNIFPLELCLFTAGALGYRFYARYLHAHAIPRLHLAYGILLTCIVLATAAVIHGLKDVEPGKDAGVATLVVYYAYVVFIALTVPFLFKASRLLTKDRFVGDLSYSFYLCHYAVMRKIFVTWSLSGWKNFLITELVTLMITLIMVKLVEIPLNRYRDRHFHHP